MTLDSISELVNVYGFLVLFLFVALDSIGIPGYPGGFTIYLMGAMCKFHLLNVFTAIVVGIVATNVVMLIMYWFGYKLEDLSDNRLSKNKNFNKIYEKVKNIIKKYGGGGIVLLRLIPAVRVFSSVILGFLKTDYKRYVVYTVLGNILYTAYSFGIGYFCTSLFV